jgi:hypothetical protein
MTEIRGLVPWLHEHKIHLEVVYIRNEANLTDASSCQRGLDMWSVLGTVHPTRVLVLGRDDLGLAGVNGPVCLQTEDRCPKIHNSSSLSSQRRFQRLPRLVADVHTVTQPALASLASSFLQKVRVSRTRGILIYPYWSLQPWFQGVAQISTVHDILPPTHLCVRPHHPVIVEVFVNREVQLRAVVFDYV